MSLIGNSLKNQCLICGSNHLEGVIDFGQVPASQGAPLALDQLDSEIRGELSIVCCQRCGHVYNQAFDESIIDKIYFQNYSSALPISDGVKKRFREICYQSIGQESLPSSAQAVEIGAADFYFSGLISEMGKGARVLCFEPSSLFKNSNPRLTHLREYFSWKRVEQEPEFSDVRLIVARHVLEHLSRPMDFIISVAEGMKTGARLYIEVPNADDIFANRRTYDFFYEHLSYFRPYNLQKILAENRLRLLKRSDLVGGQHVGFLCEKTDKPVPTPKSWSVFSSDDISGVQQSMNLFTNQVREIVRTHFGEIQIYGAGNHSISTINFLGEDTKGITCLLDINPLKSNKYSPGAHIPIRLPSKETLADAKAVMIIASLHQDEILSQLRNQFQFRGRIYGTFPSVSQID